MPHRLLRTPQLLVSVRGPDELAAAVLGGADILDLKAPERGSMGRPSAEVLHQVIAASRSISRPNAPADATNPATPTTGLGSTGLDMSVALGDAIEWLPHWPNDEKRPNEQENVPANNGPSAADEIKTEAFELPAAVAVVKIGTAGLGCEHEWSEKVRHVVAAVQASRPLVRIMLVAYADWSAAAGPEPLSVIQLAYEMELTGVLIDTFDKNSGGLCTILTVGQLVEYRLQSHRRGLQFAVAGRLTRDDIPVLIEVAPDIVGIRTAACADADRLGVVSETAVREFKLAMQAAQRARSVAAIPVVGG